MQFTRQLKLEWLLLIVAFGMLVIKCQPIQRNPANRATGCQHIDVPLNFPPSISLYQKPFVNWVGQIVVNSVWTSSVRTPEEVVEIANWARLYGWRVRPVGMRHSWSPLTLGQLNIPNSNQCREKVVLVDTTSYLTRVTIDSSSTPKAVTAQTGVTMDSLLQQLEDSMLGIVSMPVVGVITLGGALAVDGHGTYITALSGLGQTIPEGFSYGTMSNLILSLTAVVWDDSSQRYTLRQFQRSDPDIRAFLTSLGRTIITEITLQVGTNRRLRVQSYVNISGSQIFGASGSSDLTFQSFADNVGTPEVLWFPYIDKVWLKVYTLTDDVQPPESRLVTTSYNYPFIYNFDETLLLNLTRTMLAFGGNFTPVVSAFEFSTIGPSLELTHSADLWGWSKNILLYTLPTVLHTQTAGNVIVTSRENIQQVLNDFYTFFLELLGKYEATGSFPVKAALEIRITELDQSVDVMLNGGAVAQTPTFSAVKPMPDMPQFDTAVWINVLSTPISPGFYNFMTELETFMYSRYTGSYATLRVEWSKGFAYTANGPWTNEDILKSVIPESLSQGQSQQDTWEAGKELLDKYDKAGVFMSPLLQEMML